MRKILIALVIFVGLANTISAKWRPLNLPELIKYSDTIVVGIMEKIEKTDIDKFSSIQDVRFRKTDVIMGSVAENFHVQGQKLRICKAQYYFTYKKNSKYLLFLSKKANGIYRVTNGTFGALPISDDELQWYPQGKEHDFSWQREKKKLSEVITQIKTYFKDKKKLDIKP